MKLEDVRQFIIGLAPMWKNSMGVLVRSVKKFVVWLTTSGYTSIDAEKLTSHSVPKRTKVLPCFTAEEVDAILSAPDTSKPLGKRDFAMLMLAHKLGLRISDITSLKLSDIDWRKNEIVFVQNKTGKHISLPLLPACGNAIAEYILHGRPQSDSPYIFLRHRKPHDRLGADGNGRVIIKRGQKKAAASYELGDGKTFRAFRRTLGTNLVKAMVPLPTVAQTLGHSDFNSTMRYVALNDEILRVVCMDISPFASQMEGLA